MDYKLEIFYSIVPDFISENYDFNQTSLIVDEINLVLSKFKLINEEWISDYTMSAKIVSFDSGLNYQGGLKPNLIGRKEDSLKFTVKAKINIDNYVVNWLFGDSVTKVTEREELLKHLPYSISDVFGDHIFEILVLSQISRPFSLKIREGIVFINSQRFRVDLPKILIFRDYLELINTLMYPDIQYLNFYDYFNWIIENKLFFLEIPKNIYQKALINLTYVIAEENDISKFIFKMRILELIYIEGDNHLSHQLETRIQCYLGEMKTFKKKIKKMYDFRSDFVHGTSLLVPFHKSAYENEAQNKFNQGFYDADAFSFLLIISTLQKMYLENRTDLKFKVTLE